MQGQPNMQACKTAILSGGAFRRPTRLLNGGLRLTAPAKVNLFLHLTGRRPDGYHLLESLFAFTHSGDILEVLPSDRLSLSVSGPFSYQLSAEDRGAGNLVLRAAARLQAVCRMQGGAEIRLVKNLPVAAGLGGGSMDCAACLLLLCALWGVDVAALDLHGLAFELGADVPSGLYDFPQWVRGVGEKTDRAVYRGDLNILLVNPLVPLSTPAVFAAFHDYDKRACGEEGNGGGYSLPVLDTLRGRRSAPVAESSWLRQQKNDLQPAAIGLASAVGESVRMLGAVNPGGLTRMSGSGATCFSLFAREEALLDAAAKVKRQYPHWWVKADRLRSGS